MAKVSNSFFGPRDPAGLEHGGLGLDLDARLGEGLVDRARRRVADLERAVPEEHEDLVDDVLLERLGLGGLGLRREEEHHVHVAERRQLTRP